MAPQGGRSCRSRARKMLRAMTACRPEGGAIATTRPRTSSWRVSVPSCQHANSATVMRRSVSALAMTQPSTGDWRDGTARLRGRPQRLPLLLQRLGHDEGELDALLGVEARVAVGVVAVLEAGVGDRLGAAGALGDVLAGHLEVDAAGVRALGLVDGEEAPDLGQDAVERPGLVAGRGLHRIAVHRVAGPDDIAALAPEGADERRQV